MPGFRPVSQCNRFFMGTFMAWHRVGKRSSVNQTWLLCVWLVLMISSNEMDSVIVAISYCIVEHQLVVTCRNARTGEVSISNYRYEC